MNTMKFAIPLFVALAYAPVQGLAVPILAPDLASYAVLGASGVTCVPQCIIGGNLGSDPTAAVPPAANYTFTSGSFQPGSQGTAQTQLDAAILALNSFGLPTLLGSGDLSSLSPILPGNYNVPDATINISGALTLDGGGSNSALWIFHFPSTTLTTSTTSSVTVTNVGDGANVGIYWDVGSTAVLNGPTFVGNVLAGASITSDGNLTITCGRLLAATGEVTLIMDKISIGCGTASTMGFGSGGFSGGVGIEAGSQAVPEPASLALLSLGLAGLGFTRRKKA